MSNLRNFGLTDTEYERLSQGDARLQTKLFDKYVASFVSIARKMGVSIEDAEEIVSSAFAKLFCKILSNDIEKNNLEGYLYTIIKHKCYEKREMNQKNIVESREIIPDIIESETADDTMLKINKAFSRLGEKCQKLLQAFYWEDKDHKELAIEMGITEEASRQRKRECMKKMRELMGVELGIRNFKI